MVDVAPKNATGAASPDVLEHRAVMMIALAARNNNVLASPCHKPSVSAII